MKKICSMLVLCATISITMPAFAASNYEYSQNSTPVNSTILKGKVTTVPAGTIINAHVSTPLSSSTLTQGQMVNLTLSDPLYNNGVLIAEAGSTISGIVMAVTKAKHGSINGSLNIRFTEIITRSGQRIPISATIKTSDGTGVLRGGTKVDTAKSYAKDLTVGAGAGALTGLIGAAISGGSIGKGAAIMTGVGAGVGLAKSVWDQGEDVNIPSNATIELYFNQPVTVDTKKSYSYEY
jgi:hypothetical protein